MKLNKGDKVTVKMVDDHLLEGQLIDIKAGSKPFFVLRDNAGLDFYFTDFIFMYKTKEVSHDKQS